ncbi:hypothetical protein HDU96_001559, partial [Phlyctochytrium bullatum]
REDSRTESGEAYGAHFKGKGKFNKRDNREKGGNGSSSQDKSNIICFKCNKKGHYARDCYSKSRGNYQNKSNRRDSESEDSDGQANYSGKYKNRRSFRGGYRNRGRGRGRGGYHRSSRGESNNISFVGAFTA